MSKQLLPAYDKPMIYYPLTTLMLAGLRDILVIATPDDLHRYQELLGDGSQWGVSLAYIAQDEPRGSRTHSSWRGTSSAATPSSSSWEITSSSGRTSWASCAAQSRITGARPSSPAGCRTRRDSASSATSRGRVADIVEKPSVPLSNHAVTGLYVYSNEIVAVAESLVPSPRGELEITDVNRYYLRKGRLEVVFLGRGIAWLDTGTHDTLLQASQFVQTIEHRQGLKIACPEEVAWRMGWISESDLIRLAEGTSPAYRDYLAGLLEEPGAP